MVTSVAGMLQLRCWLASGDVLSVYIASDRAEVRAREPLEAAAVDGHASQYGARQTFRVVVDAQLLCTSGSPRVDDG